MAGYRKLSRTSSQRKALIRGQVTALLQHGKIVTTESKAKEVRKAVEEIVEVKVKSVNIMNVRVKDKRLGRYTGKTARRIKAIRA